MADFTPKPVEIEDGLAKWYKANDGRLYARLKEKGEFNDPNFLAACVDACNNNFPKGGKQDAFPYNDETFSLNGYMGQVKVYKGEARFPNKELVKLPDGWGQGNSFSSGGYKKAFTPAKIIVPNAIKKPKLLSINEALEDCKTEGRLLFYTTQGFNEEREGIFVYTGEAPVA